MVRKKIALPSDDNRHGQRNVKEPEVSSDGTDFDPRRLKAKIKAQTAHPDLFDPAFLGLTQDFASEANVAKKWDVIKKEKPSKSRVFRVHPDTKFRLKTILLTLKEDDEVYLVLPQLRPALFNESLCGLFTLFACITKSGTPFLWPIRMADSDGKWNIWHQSAWQIAEKAQTRWTRMQANRDAGHYVAEYDQRPLEQQYEPAWPAMPFRDWLELAFKDFTIDSLDHPVLKRLRMED
jgi:hypothetical protein